MLLLSNWKAIELLLIACKERIIEMNKIILRLSILTLPTAIIICMLIISTDLITLMTHGAGGL